MHDQDGGKDDDNCDAEIDTCSIQSEDDTSLFASWTDPHLSGI